MKKIFKLLIKYLKEFVSLINYKFKDMIAKILYRKIEDKVMFATTSGTYSCNPKFICEEIIKQDLPYKLVWAVHKRNLENEIQLNEYPSKVKLVVKGSFEFFKELNTSKVLIDNENNFGRRYFYKKRKNQIYFQTWHGSMGLKRICVDRGLTSRIVMKQTRKYQSQVNYCISNSEFENEIFRTTYWPYADIIELGHARNDILINKKDKEYYTNKVFKHFNITKDTKILLYAPTFRENDKIDFKIDFNEVRKSLEKRFGGKWKIMVRFHEKDIYNYNNYAKENNIIDATLYPDIQELLVAIDVGVTDYSSWICDYVLTRKPGFLLTPDLKKYDTAERGFYFPLESTPFKVCMSDKELCKNILDFDEKEYDKKVDEFLKARGCFEKGDASIKIVNKIKEVIEDGNKRES